MIQTMVYKMWSIVVNIVVMTCWIRPLTTGYCAKQNSTGKLEFTQELGFRDYVGLSEGVTIICCAQGFEKITWYTEHKGRWEKFIPVDDERDYNTPRLEENGQLLRIFAATLNDQTNYRCDVTNGSNIIRHITNLTVIECDKLARGPYSTFPFPENKTIYDFGANLTLYCSGYFGCYGNGDIRLVVWNVDGHYDSKIEDLSPRYKVEYFNYSNNTVKEARLTISAVQEIDTTRTFVCTMANDQEHEGHTNLRVKITKKDFPKTPWMKIGIITGGTGLLIVIIFGSIASLKSLYGPQIKLFLSSRVSTLAPKIVDRESFSYNLFIYHAVEDERIVREIKGDLRCLGYSVFITADIKGNENVMNVFFEKSVKSAMVMFLYSDALKKDELANLFVQSFIRERKGKDIMFLEIVDYKAKDVMDWAKHVNKRLKPRKQERGNDDLGTADDNSETSSGTINNGETANEHNIDETANNPYNYDELRFWKVLPRIKVPSDKNNKRKFSYYMCSLQNRIPRFNDQERPKCDRRVKKDRNSSSLKPLLGGGSVSEPVSANGGSPNSAEFSPSTDDVFAFS